MSRGTRTRRRTWSIVVAVASAVAAAAPLIRAPHATSAPSFVVHDITVESAHLDAALPTRVRVPATTAPEGGWPVLWLFHGSGENHTTWTNPMAGDLNGILPDLEAVVVMPDVRGSWLTDHYANPFAPGGWTSYILEELIPQVDARFPTSRDRRLRAIAGASMGGMGAVMLASQRPDLFGTAVSLSGALDHQHLPMYAGIEVTAAGDGGYYGIFGPRDGHYAAGHNPVRLTANLQSTRTMVFVGDGTPDPGNVEAHRAAAEPALLDKVFLTALGAPIELVVREHADSFVAAAYADGVPVVHEVLHGTHEWPSIRRQLVHAAGYGLFEGSSAAPASWTFRTARPSGQAWDFEYRFDARPAALVTFSYQQAILRATGTGVVTVTGNGCSFTTPLPFERMCPPGGSTG